VTDQEVPSHDSIRAFHPSFEFSIPTATHLSELVQLTLFSQSPFSPGSGDESMDHFAPSQDSINVSLAADVEVA
jgi:hypothetical protein